MPPRRRPGRFARAIAPRSKAAASAAVRTSPAPIGLTTCTRGAANPPSRRAQTTPRRRPPRSRRRLGTAAHELVAAAGARGCAPGAASTASSVARTGRLGFAEVRRDDVGIRPPARRRARGPPRRPQSGRRPRVREAARTRLRRAGRERARADAPGAASAAVDHRLERRPVAVRQPGPGSLSDASPARPARGRSRSSGSRPAAGTPVQRDALLGDHRRRRAAGVAGDEADERRGASPSTAPRGRRCRPLPPGVTATSAESQHLAGPQLRQPRRAVDRQVGAGDQQRRLAQRRREGRR